jgi:hypothetical protein
VAVNPPHQNELLGKQKTPAAGTVRGFEKQVGLAPNLLLAMKKRRVTADKADKVSFPRALLELCKAALGGLVRACVTDWLDKH